MRRLRWGGTFFYDERLSANETQSCGTCHLQERAFAGFRVVAEGSTGDIVPRNTPGLQNVAYNSTFTWLNPNFLTLEAQIHAPIFNEFPVELGATGSEDEILERLRSDATYKQLFFDAYPNAEDPYTFEFIIQSLACFVRSMVSFESPDDREKLWDEDNVMSAATKRGFVMTQLESLDCFHYHTGFQFALGTRTRSSTFFERGYFNNGLYNIGGTGDYPPESQGLHEFTGNDSDKGKFRAQTLRNILLTAPYMHDGSIETIDGVIDHYARGGRLVQGGDFAGDGRDNPNKSEFVHGFELSPSERADLMAFFESLTDPEFIVDPRLSNPWE